MSDVTPADLHHLIVVGHPDRNSFNHAVAAAYADMVRQCGQSPTIRDLYAIGFDPLLRSTERPESKGFHLSPDVEWELELIRTASVITLVYPIWFGMPPAIITGYIDRVLGAGLTATAIRHNQPHEMLANKYFVLVTTSGSTLPWLAERGQWEGMRESFDSYLETIFSFAEVEHEHLDSIVSPLSPDYAAQCLGRVADRARFACSAVLCRAHEQQKIEKLKHYQERGSL
ncbi:NAD(P)H-dependent oxidoreductase [Sphingomonas lycopersici]|uniref:NAD(P)H-dependent oxidoreductase n=1 Tax=Sphingomonas lycopersici TaxID=2951807 RepID=A0AA41ZG51_9SPHN|nr:NAD(P)H-dependent oxidoreductase [Sphingomonas lycopersici]MCW6536006.1 NAD(P)H-dependent oxidoreductase [Sphingomonas lycopersici]